MATPRHPARISADRRFRGIPALFAPALFLSTAGVLSAANLSALRQWGWTPLDHHGVPWPSSLAVLPHGWLMGLTFAGTGAAVIALATALPRSGRALALSITGAGLIAAAFSLDVPAGDPASLASWIQSWPAVVHAGGFVVAGLAGLVAVAASRRRADLGFAAVLAVAAALGGTPGWYAYLVGFFVWVTLLARWTVGGVAEHAPSATPGAPARPLPISGPPRDHGRAHRVLRQA